MGCGVVVVNGTEPAAELVGDGVVNAAVELVGDGVVNGTELATELLGDGVVS